MSRTAVRVNRRARYLHIESATVRDSRISYRALGLLSYLLDQSDEWQVRSEQLCKGEAREGRDAVRKALRELAAAGYYRLERRQFRDGKQAMGTAVSEFPVEQWAEDFKTFGEKMQIPVVEQQDGTFLVRYPDGSFGSDGFEADPADQAPADGPAEADDPGAEDTVDAPEPKPRPAAATPSRTRASTPKVTVTERKAAAEEKAEEEKAFNAAAEEVAAWWWAHAEQHLGAYVGKKGGYLAMRKQVRAALVKNYSPKQCALALQHARKHWPSAQQWQYSLGVVTNHIQPAQRDGRIAYSDVATWGPAVTEPTETTTTDTPDDDDATFGVLTD
ncbi:hypothetical protein ACGFYQ_33655 [Streptomyces sp. NPDC048258]|uniref:hypothetical protein n=1 Tax=Streptomyces sp. NPDC048258 TaxID=3365527 RepID=UPI00371C74E1